MIGDEVFYDVLDAQSPKQKPTNKVKKRFFHYFTVSLNLGDWKILLQKSSVQHQIFFSSAGVIVVK